MDKKTLIIIGLLILCLVCLFFGQTFISTLIAIFGASFGLTTSIIASKKEKKEIEKKMQDEKNNIDNLSGDDLANFINRRK